ncbi:metalloprotease [Saccharomonospora piscinae]|uniref:Metalloprotease n=1 Tax=Saccharomonospora piscinae TaxID=687388 RepID=A0A1V8ZWY5_SACPI|nr:neutral zinc metallopeptidase [Saccharomonospora piscinae]OQO89283.1 metalloprotease [Saccharomonospora piscinae]TLW90971.1 metalloprotease [Saccharomonospora piscinae]
MHTVGDAAEEPGSRPGPVRPYLDDLPLELWEADERPAPAPRRRRRRPGWNTVLPVVVALALVGALVFVVPLGEDEGGSRPGAVPAEPEVSSLASIGDNPLLRRGTNLPDVRCDLPGVRADHGALHRFYSAELRCLDRAWEPALTGAGLDFERVTVDVTDDPATACGALPPPERATGLYCAEDATIYLPRQRTLDAFGLSDEAHLATLAHEYGHHVQHLSGILSDANGQLNRYPAGSPPDRELGRRVELQANCFAGAFFSSASGRGSITDGLADDSVDDFRNWVDSDTHGTSDTQREWALRGYRKGDVGTCNTWHAASADVT